MAIQKRSDAAKDTAVGGTARPRSRKQSKKSVVSYLIALFVVVVLVILLSFAIGRRNEKVEEEASNNIIEAMIDYCKIDKKSKD